MSERLDHVGAEVNPTTFAHPTLVFLREYWDRKRGDRLMPARKDIAVADLKDHLGWVMIVDVLPGLADFRYRLVGTLVTQYFLADGTGKTVSELFASQGQAAINGVQAMFRKTARDCIPMRAYGDAGWIGRGFEQFEAIYLPLSDDGETVNVILHAFVFDRSRVLMAREIARANGGQLPDQPSPPSAA